MITRVAASRSHVASLGAIAVAIASLAQAQVLIPTGRTKTGLAYDKQGSGPAVVLVTGSNLDRRMWDAETTWLKSQFTVIRYDLRAHGRSSIPVPTLSPADDLLALLDEIGVQKATLIGLSAGSTIVLDTALQAPDRVDRLVMAAPSISGYVPKERPAFVGELMTALQARDYKKAGEVLLTSSLFDVPAASRPLVQAMVMENDRLWLVPRELMKPPARPALERLEQVAAPTLVLVGEKDLADSREQAQILSKRVPRAQLVVVPGGGHLLNLTSPDAFRQQVMTFLGGR